MKVSVSMRMTARSTTFCNSRIFPGGPLAERASGRHSIARGVLRRALRQRVRQECPTYRQTNAGAVTGVPGESEASPKRGLSALDDREVEMIEAALAETHRRISGPTGAAAKLGIPHQTIESRSGGWASTSTGRSDSPLNSAPPAAVLILCPSSFS